MLTGLLGAAGSLLGGGGGGSAAAPGVLDSGHVNFGDVNVGAKNTAANTWATPLAVVLAAAALITGLYFILRRAPRR